MKRKTAKEILAESFKELSEAKDIDKITIQDIVGNCGYSPATFYRHFRDKYDLIAWEYAQGTTKIMSRIDGKHYTWKQTLLDGAMRYQSQKEYLVNLFRHTSGHDAFIQYMADINFAALKSHILAVSGKRELSGLEEMCTRTYCLGTVCLTCEWLLGLYEAAPDEITEVYERSLPEPLRAYLL